MQEGEFGDLNLNLVTRPAVRRYMDWRHEAPVAANRELAVLQACFKWAAEYGLVEQNPCVGIRKYREKARDRYVSEAEYQAVYSRASLYYQVAMELAFLCRGRAEEVRLLRKDQVTLDGIDWKRVKGSRDQLVRWSDRLRAAVQRASTTSANSSSEYLLLGPRGKALTEDGFSAGWQRLMKQSVKEAGIKRFTFHDLKARGVTDFDGNKGDATGDWSPDMRRVYVRQPQRIDPTA